MKISDRQTGLDTYWPDFINRFPEFFDLGLGFDNEYQVLLDMTQFVEDQMSVDRADETGLNIMAGEYDVVFPSDYTLEDKRIAIKMAVLARNKYTKVILKRMLDSVLGPEYYKWRIDFAGQTLWIRLDLARKNQRQEVYKMLRRVIPACMKIDLDLLYNQLYMLTKFTVEELKKYTVLDLKENPGIKQIYIERGGELL